MRKAELLQEIRKMRFEESFSIWTEGRITQEAARMLNVTPRTFRRYVDRYQENGLDGLIGKRLTQTSARKAPVDEVMALADRYKALTKAGQPNISTLGIVEKAAPAATRGLRKHFRKKAA